MAEDIGAKDASIKVVSNIPVIPERAMYRNNRREGHDSIGTAQAASDYYLAEGLHRLRLHHLRAGAEPARPPRPT